MDDMAYEYRKQARRARGYIALALSMLLLEVTAKTPVQMWVQIAIWVFLAMTLWRLVQNRSGHLLITNSRMEVFRNGRKLGTFPLARITAARVRRRVFGNDECMLVLADGRRAFLPPEAIPPAERLCEELHARGVPLA
ncbi:hypothetical protein [Thioclava atlantica]|uniref:PH domain-containing protein n=1 Tax=Thioclava atlantica TaxID=1317124 RepID=A0A085TSR6_9RHOB|nr:hypothetical protein [Thioclava atlantica]KFE33763.1 hypothetical protein DW2_16085 [Thioclava atlantica]